MRTSRLSAPRGRSPLGRLAAASAAAVGLASVVVAPTASASTPAKAPVASAGSEAAVTGALATFYRPPSPLLYAPAGTIIRSQALAADPGLPAGA
jgi:hypothetical protein